MTKIKNNITELVFILDKSGSMGGLESDTVGGFNSFVEKQKKENGKCFVSTILFSNESEVLHDRLSLDTINPLTVDDYITMGSTALLDAIGGTINHIENIHKYARAEDVPEHTVFVIMTDGMENSSHIFTADAVKKMIEQKKKTNGWEFLFIGANIDAVSSAANIGINSDRAVNYNADSTGTEVVFDTVSDVVGCVRIDKDIYPCWSEPIDVDYKKRGKNKPQK